MMEKGVGSGQGQERLHNIQLRFKRLVPKIREVLDQKFIVPT